MALFGINGTALTIVMEEAILTGISFVNYEIGKVGQTHNDFESVVRKKTEKEYNIKLVILIIVRPD